MLTPISSDAPLDPKAEKRLRKEAERIDDTRVLDPWERYRALSDHCDAVVDIAEFYDKKTRFALVVLGGLNAINLLLATRVDMFKTLSHGTAIMRGYAALYALLSVYFLAHAIAALKPRAGSERRAAVGTRGLLQPTGGRRPGVEDFCNNWREVPVGELNRELAIRAYWIAESNEAKLRSLQRVFYGLYVLTGLTAAVVVFLILAATLP